jgi:hypothetical protein
MPAGQPIAVPYVNTSGQNMIRWITIPFGGTSGTLTEDEVVMLHLVGRNSNGELI